MLKDSVSGLGANIVQPTVLQCGKSLNGMMDVCKAFDEQHDLYVESSSHRKPSSSKDEHLIIEELTKLKLFHYIPGSQHRTFCGIKPNPAEKLDLGTKKNKRHCYNLSKM